MRTEALAPTPFQVVQAIARREIGIALRRRLVKLLFLANVLPPLILAVVLVVRTLIEGAGLRLEWDPLEQFLQVQMLPVLFLALAIGTPSVARDRSEDVLFLYATRPVTPWSYTFGKIAAVAVPSVALLLVPGVLIAVLRMGLLAEVGALEALVLLAKVLTVAVLMAVGYAGVCVGASAATKRTRWALVTAFAAVFIPRTTSQIASLFLRGPAYPVDAPRAVRQLVEAFFGGGWDHHAMIAVLALLAWGGAGAGVTAATVKREMTP